MKKLANKNKNLNTAAKAKKDEFYTQLSDIERELKHYNEHFKNKVVLCNCDDPYESQFFKYFAMNFNFLGLKKLITTCYKNSPISQTEISLFDTPIEETDEKIAFSVEINEVRDYNGDGAVDLSDVEILLKMDSNNKKILKDGGDFRSAECVELLKQADIVVTNPPFSLFREYVRQLIDFDKKFLIIGNINAITYKEIFPLIMQNKIWLGYGMGRAISGFIVPDRYELYGTEARIENGKRIVSTNQCFWLTNLDIKKRHEDIILFRNYSPENYPKYDNYDAIEVSKTADIPCDYFGVMGVPITFLDKYNPDQFEILGLIADKRNENPAFIQGTPTYLDEGHKKYVGAIVNGKATYARILIRRKKN